MNTKDKKPDEKETVRTGNEESRPKGEDAPYEDSVELFSSLFRAETEAITKQGGEASQGPKADSKPGKAGVSPPSQGSGPPRAKAPAPGPQARGARPKGPPTKPLPQGPKAADRAVAPQEKGKRGPGAPGKQAGSAPPEKRRIPGPQAKKPAQGPPPPKTGPEVQQGPARRPTKPAAGDMPPREEAIQGAPEPPGSPGPGEAIPVKGKGGKGGRILKLVILLALLAVLAAFSLYYFGIIGVEKPKRAATPVKGPREKAQITRKVQKRPPKKVTKAAPGPVNKASVKKAPVQKATVEKAPVKQVQAQMPQQGAPAPETPKSPAQETGTAPVAATPELPKSPTPPAIPPAAPKALPAPAAALSLYPYSVYLGSYKTRESLEKAVSEYGSLGLSSYWVQVDLGAKGIWYRVFTGYFPNRGDAAAFIREKNIQDGEGRNTRYANLIGVFRSEKELQKPRVSVEEAGFCPYTVQGPDGQWMLYTGAFYQKSRAEKQNRELRSKGIQSRLVER